MISVFHVTGPETAPLFRPQGRAGHSRTEPLEPEQPSLAELLQDLSLSGREELFFMQLPDCMPGKLKADPAVAPTEKPAKKEGKSDEKRSAHLQAQVSFHGEPCICSF